MARTASYDPATVVQAAMELFWEDGFAASDVERLTRAAGVNRHSLYKAFDGKAGLFRRALAHYVAEIAAPFIAVLEQGSGLAAIHDYFLMASDPAHHGAPGHDRRGCLLANSVIELGRSDPAVNAVLDPYYARIEQQFARLIAEGQRRGEIRKTLAPAATARWLLITSQGMGVAARHQAPTDAIPAMIRTALVA